MIEVPLKIDSESGYESNNKQLTTDQFSISGRTTLSTSGRSIYSDETTSYATGIVKHQNPNELVLAKKEQNGIFRTKICLAFVLLVAVVGVSVGAAKLIIDGEQRDFEDQVRKS